MIYLFFDTETNGLPKDWRQPMQNTNAWPRIIQLAFMVCDENSNELYSFKSLIKPDGWIVPEEKFWLDHGYSTKKNEEEGVSMQLALDNFLHWYNQSDAMVAHNMSFDYRVVGAELIRYNKKAGRLIPNKYCTKDLSTDYCELPGNYGRYKWPKLEELHRKLFGIDFEGAHDAMSDVIALKDCFFELKRLGIICTP